MLFRTLADITVVVHLTFVLFATIGGLLVIYRPQLAWLHLPAVAWGAWVEFAGWVCPLTPLENWFRQQSGAPAYTVSFIERYLVPILYPYALSRELQWKLGFLVLLINAAMYLLVVRRYLRR